MTKKELKKEMIFLIHKYYQKAEELEDEERKKTEYAKVAGIERLASHLKIKLWQNAER